MEDLENIEEYSSEEEEEIMENNPLDKLIPNHKELSREEIGKEIFKFVNKINDDPEVIKQNEEMQHNALMKLLGIIKNEAPSKSPITLRTLQKEFIDMGEKYNNESSESEEEEEEEEEK